MKVTDMFDTFEHDTHELLFKSKGLPEALILEAQKVYPDKIIVSDAGAALWEPGRAVWRRLVKRNLATYDKTRDMFILNK